jgi:hypothetical protein
MIEMSPLSGLLSPDIMEGSVSIREQSFDPNISLQLANSRRPAIFIATVFSCSSKAFIFSPVT